MKNPLFKSLEEPLSPREEEEITKELSEAYRQTEHGEKQPEFRRIVEKVKERISKESNDQ
jgi:hypothetical protein